MGSEAIFYESMRKQFVLDKRILINIQKKVFCFFFIYSLNYLMNQY